MDGRSLENLEENVREQDEQSQVETDVLVYDLETGKFRFAEPHERLYTQDRDVFGANDYMQDVRSAKL